MKFVQDFLRLEFAQHVIPRELVQLGQQAHYVLERTAALHWFGAVGGTSDSPLLWYAAAVQLSVTGPAASSLPSPSAYHQTAWLAIP